MNNSNSIDWKEVEVLRREIKYYGSFGHSEAFSLRIGMAKILEEEGEHFEALCQRREAYMILCLFYRRRKHKRRLGSE